MIKEFKDEYHWLSNFFDCELEYEGISYPTVEHFYVSMKTTDIELRQTISKIETPGKAKRFGQKEIDIRDDWDDIKISIMQYGLNVKFNKPYFKELLLSTGDQKIIEGNLWHDNFYGSCHCDECGDKGRNILGKMIMELRTDK